MMQFLRDLWGGLTDRLSSEPVMVLAVIQMGVALGVAFGLNLTAAQTGAIVAFTAAVLGLIARSKVSPT
jgi:nitrate/nitrite transporter NarK